MIVFKYLFLDDCDVFVLFLLQFFTTDDDKLLNGPVVELLQLNSSM
jgi:hypothetical protein